MPVMWSLKSWLSAERGRAARLAAHLKVSPSFVTKMGAGEKPIPATRGAAIEEFTQDEVTRQQMFPADWHLIWPELVGTPGAPTPTPMEARDAA